MLISSTGSSSMSAPGSARRGPENTSLPNDRASISNGRRAVALLAPADSLLRRASFCVSRKKTYLSHLVQLVAKLFRKSLHPERSERSMLLFFQLLRDGLCGEVGKAAAYPGLGQSDVTFLVIAFGVQAKGRGGQSITEIREVCVIFFRISSLLVKLAARVCGIATLFFLFFLRKYVGVCLRRHAVWRLGSRLLVFRRAI